MKNQAFFIGGVVLLTSIAACKKTPEPVPCEDSTAINYPLTPGTYWVYDWYQVSDTSAFENQINTTPDTTFILGDTMINGVEYKIFKERHFSMNNYEISYYRDSSGFLVSSTGVIKNVPSYYTPAYSQGDIGGGYAISYSLNPQVTSTTVPAGTFDAYISTLKVTRNSNFGCLNQDEYLLPSKWFVPGIGLVKVAFAYTSQLGCGHTERRLIDYHIAE